MGRAVERFSKLSQVFSFELNPNKLKEYLFALIRESDKLLEWRTIHFPTSIWKIIPKFIRTLIYCSQWSQTRLHIQLNRLKDLYLPCHFTKYCTFLNSTRFRMILSIIYWSSLSPVNPSFLKLSLSDSELSLELPSLFLRGWWFFSSLTTFDIVSFFRESFSSQF